MQFLPPPLVVYNAHPLSPGAKNLEDFLTSFWETWALSKDPENLLTMLYTWQAGDVSCPEKLEHLIQELWLLCEHRRTSMVPATMHQDRMTVGEIGHCAQRVLDRSRGIPVPVEEDHRDRTGDREPPTPASRSGACPWPRPGP